MGSDEVTKFNCIITGAGGFVGQALASALLADPLVSKLTLTDVFKPDVPQTTSQSGVETRCLDADLTSLETCQSLFTPDINLIYLLHGIMSGAAEANLELGLKVNIDSTRQILDILRHTNPGVKVIYPSSLAVYGPPATPTTKITELNTPVPGTSYGAQKHIFRPGKPTGAASSFASGIFREPLKGEKCTLPVSKDLEIWICSPRTVVKNLIIARDIPKEKFPGTRLVNIPGVTVTIREMLEALKAVGGDEALKLVEEKRDDATEKIVLSWPTRLDISRAKALGFAEDGTLTNTLKEYIDDYGGMIS
ncbi:MAG: hypothetical protein ASARMPREDX12_000732 [Alectoria sarmentosa]|nr:MAG: hypothetical protein ASARMPREDX12_000732 [Alectoria sarmentosa]